MLGRHPQITGRNIGPERAGADANRQNRAICECFLGSVPAPTDPAHRLQRSRRSHDAIADLQGLNRNFAVLTAYSRTAEKAGAGCQLQVLALQYEMLPIEWAVELQIDFGPTALGKTQHLSGGIEFQRRP